jgi:type II restriction enzyme
MNAHTKEEFDIFISQLIETNASLDFFSDFKKIDENVEKISIKLNQLNYLIGKTDMESAVHELWNENPKVFDVLDILIAIRTSDKKKVLDKNGNIHLIEEFFTSPEGVIDYIHDTGLRNVLQNKSDLKSCGLCIRRRDWIGHKRQKKQKRTYNGTQNSRFIRCQPY